MKATLEFNLESYDDELSHRRCIDALNMALCINDITVNIRKDTNRLFESEKSYTAEEMHQIIFDKITDAIENRSLNLNNLLY